MQTTTSPHRTRVLIRVLVVLLALVLLVPAYVHLSAQQAFALPATYYIDYRDGNDTTCDGHSPNVVSSTQCSWKTFLKVTGHSFNPGDAILLEDGETWQDTAASAAYLHPWGSGLAVPNGGTIVVSDYCDSQENSSCSQAPKPLLEGYGDTTVVELDNQQYWKISNLEITNLPAGCQFFSSCSAKERGVWIHGLSSTATTLHHIYLDHLIVHDIAGETGVSPEARVTGGIIFQIETGGGPTIWDDIQVTNTLVYNVNRNGIFFQSDYQGGVHDDNSPRGYYPCHLLTPANWQPSTNILVDGNTVHDLGGSGITVTVGWKEQLSNNIAYNGQQDGSHSVDIWTEDSFAAVIKNNTVYNWQFHGADSGHNQQSDATAFDTDDCDIGAIFEYNFSHDNQGGFLLAVCDSQLTVVRYNISEHDGYGDPNRLNTVVRDFLINNNNAGTQTGNGMAIYNNDIYMDDLIQSDQSPGTGLIQFQTGLAIQPFFKNNLVDNQQTAANTSCSKGQFAPGSGGTNWTVDHNDFYGAQSGGVCPDTPSQNSAITGDPLFTKAGQAYNATAKAGVIADYTLLSGSPALCHGASITANGGVDFAGQALPGGNVDAGALEIGPNSC